MKILQDLSLSELEMVLTEFNEPKYRAKQIFENIYLGKTIEEMTNIPKDLKQKLQEQFVDEPIKIYKVQTLFPYILLFPCSDIL